MRIDIMTLFPDAVDAMMNASIIGRAQERGFVTIRTHQIREFTTMPSNLFSPTRMQPCVSSG